MNRIIRTTPALFAFAPAIDAAAAQAAASATSYSAEATDVGTPIDMAQAMTLTRSRSRSADTVADGVPAKADAGLAKPPKKSRADASTRRGRSPAGKGESG